MIGDDLAAALPELRAQAESMMLDACMVLRAGAGKTWNDESGSYDPWAPVSVYSGPCRVQSTQATQAAQPVAGETEWTTTAYIVSLPVSAPEARLGDVVRITASTFDPQLAGRDFTVASTIRKTYLTARRVIVEEVS